MKILIIGNGGREHAIGLKLSESPQKPTLIFAPGNPGMETLGQCFPIAADDLPHLLALAQQEKVDLTVVGPEIPLVAGIVDMFRWYGLKIFGPTKAAAQLEGSKAFSKNFMAKYRIPTALYQNFTDYTAAHNYLQSKGAPIVVKASGLAAGKGAIVCMTMDEAYAAVDSMLGPNAEFGAAGAEVVIEEFMEGEEASLFVLTDGQDYVLLPSAQDHKRIFDDDKGPNTGGMGAYAPAPVLTPELLRQVEAEIVKPSLEGMLHEGIPYTGILFIGLMLTPQGPKVVEYNCRLGDPETQAVLPILEADLVELFWKASQQKLAGTKIPEPLYSAAVVVMVSGGYPGKYATGFPILGLATWASHACHIIHAGTQKNNEQIVTQGGRVLGLVGVGEALPEAIQAAYQGISKIEFEGMHYRKDIGHKGLTRLFS